MTGTLPPSGPIGAAPTPGGAHGPHRRSGGASAGATRLALALVLAGALASPSDLDAQQRLTLDEAIELARAYSPGLQLARNDEAVADWDLRAARGNLLVPNLGLGTGVQWQGAGTERIGGLTSGELGVGGQPSFLFSSYSLGLSYGLNLASLRAPALARAGREAAAARSAGAEADLVLRVTQAYLDFTRQEEALRLARRQTERAEANYNLARGLADVGTATPLEAMQAEIQVGRARIAVLEAEQGIRTSRLGLLRVIGLERDRDIVPGTGFAPFDMTLDEAELTRLALAGSPELQSLRAGVSVAGRRAASAGAAYWPSVQFQAGWSGFTRQATDDSWVTRQIELGAEQSVAQCEFQNEIFRRLADPFPPQDCTLLALTPEQLQGAIDRNRQFPFDFTRQPPSASVSVSIPIFQGAERRRGVETARIEEENARLRLREAEQGLLSDVATLVAQVRITRAQVELEERNREVAEAQLRLAVGEFEVGAGTFLQVAEAETVAAQADRDHLEALFRFHDAVARLEALTGAMLRPR
jgi:outer membrane protein TolC